MSTVSDSIPSVHDIHSDANVAFPADFDYADYNAYLDEIDARRALLDDGPTEPEPQYLSGVAVHGRKFKAFVSLPNGGKVQCGTWPTEMQAWSAADRKAAELRAA